MVWMFRSCLVKAASSEAAFFGSHVTRFELTKQTHPSSPWFNPSMGVNITGIYTSPRRFFEMVDEDGKMREPE